MQEKLNILVPLKHYQKVQVLQVFFLVYELIKTLYNNAAKASYACTTLALLKSASASRENSI